MNSKRLKIILTIAVLAWSFYGASKRDYAKNQTSSFENLLIDSFAPLQSGITSVNKSFTSFFSHYFFNVNASKNNMKLQKELASLRAELFATKELSKENLRLKKLLQLTASLPGKKVSARIVGRDASSDFKVLRINKGFSHGIELQSTVVTSEGVVGYIYQMTEHYADVLTLLDSNNHLDAIVGRTRTHGIVEGHTGNKCIMKYVSRPVPLILGDIILTSGLGNVYPKGLKIGIVSRIEKESYGITQDIEVTPSVDFTKLEEVVVLVKPSGKKMNKEWEALNNNSSEDNK